VISTDYSDPERHVMERHIGLIDLDTGKLLDDGVPVWVGARPRSPYGE
jgi:hypothetical protein